MKTKNKLKIYYIVEWNNNSLSNSFIQYQINIKQCYKLKEGYINIYEYKKDPKDDYYISDRWYTRKDFCFKVNKKDIFTDLEKAKVYAFEKIDEMYLSRWKYLIQQRDEAIDKINEDN